MDRVTTMINGVLHGGTSVYAVGGTWFGRLTRFALIGFVLVSAALYWYG